MADCNTAHKHRRALQADIAREAVDHRHEVHQVVQGLSEVAHHFHIDQTRDQRNNEPRRPGKEALEARLVLSDFLCRTRHAGDCRIGDIFQGVERLFAGDQTDHFPLTHDRKGVDLVALDGLDDLFTGGIGIRCMKKRGASVRAAAASRAE